MIEDVLGFLLIVVIVSIAAAIVIAAIQDDLFWLQRQFHISNRGDSLPRFRRQLTSSRSNTANPSDAVQLKLDIVVDLERQVSELSDGVSPRLRGQNWRSSSFRRIRYDDYLNTPGWKSVRNQALKRAGYRCVMCNTVRGLQVHHRTYRNLGSESLDDLTVLCRKCHEQFHTVR